MKSGTSLPTEVVRSSIWSSKAVSDPKAFERLNNLLRPAADRLAKLGQNPVAIAASPNRFDDAWTYEWRAVRCGTFFSEKDSYMGRYNLDRDMVNAPAEAKAALAILDLLETAGWRDLFADAFDMSWGDESLSLVVQDGLTWLVFSSNQWTNLGDPVFAIWDDASFSYFGEAEDRFDWAIQDTPPLVFLKPGSSGSHEGND
jgi:hypothetical protein